MKLKILVVFLFSVATLEARAQCSLTFPSLSVCTGSSCTILIDAQPSGLGRVLSDNTYGTGLNINFGEHSIFDLGHNGRLNFGVTGGTQAVRTDSSGTLACTDFIPGLLPYTVEMTPGGWLDFTANNRFQLNAGNIFSLAGGSKIDGRLVIESEGTVTVGSTGEMAMPNMDLDGPDGITLSGQGDLRVGNLTNRDGSASNQGINISADGDVEIGVVDGDGDFSVMAGGDINIREVRNADSISLMIMPPASGIIKIGTNQTTDNSVMCSPPDDCDGFELDGGGASNDCNAVNPDPSAPNNCPGGGGATGLGFVLLCVTALFGRRRLRTCPSS